MTKDVDWDVKHKTIKNNYNTLLLLNPFNILHTACTVSSTLHIHYGKCSKISNTFVFLFSNIMLVIRAKVCQIFGRIANSADPDQTASSEAV